MALRHMMQKITAAGSRERSINWSVQLEPLTQALLLVVAWHMPEFQERIGCIFHIG
jgi:hypothetical protein